MNLLKVDTITTAREKLKEIMNRRVIETISIELRSAQGYILAKDIVSHEMVPAFKRSTVDGYAVVSSDTAGASENLPVFLEIVDEVSMGEQSRVEIHKGQCVYVPTGGMIPTGADAMVMVEYCEIFEENQIAVYSAVANGKNLVLPGEDMRVGDVVLRRGTRIGPREIGALACLGIVRIEVYKPLTVTILSTGDELVSPDSTLPIGKIRDINTYLLQAEAVKLGFLVVETKVLVDDEELLKRTMLEAMTGSDMVIVSGGSSQGKKDATERIIDEVASMGSFLHGLAIKPGKPTILGYDEDTSTLLVGLPGHPVAAFLVFKLLIGWMWEEMTGQTEQLPVVAHITSNLASAPGKLTCQLVNLYKQGIEFYAEPIFGKSGLITTLTRSNGYILIDQNKEGLRKDEVVEVFYL
ncbi:MAG TPA: gephyrin-like molybdotransferase Glp [Lachnospiraceae bacterium]|nr:gephyrin-like molybdotransferase Glp [Lachnospiraceae bacterium]